MHFVRGSTFNAILVFGHAILIAPFVVADDNHVAKDKRFYPEGSERVVWLYTILAGFVLFFFFELLIHLFLFLLVWFC